MTRPDRSKEDRTLQDRFRDLDLVSLTFGLLALGIAAIYLAGELDGRAVRLGAVVSYAVGVLAVAGLLAGLRRALGNRSS